VATLEAGISDGLHLGAQLYVSLRGETVADLAVGENSPGVPLTSDTLMLWQSCTKPTVAVALARLWERGALDLDDPVMKFIPEFGANGKEGVTLRHILTHTCGFRYVKVRWFSEPWQAGFDRICEARLEPGWNPGLKAGYHAATSWLILGEVVHRLDGRPIDKVIREDVFRPLGMADSWLAMTEDEFYAYAERIGISYDTSLGVPRPLPLVDSVEGCTRARPGSSGRGPARELGRFYEMLINRGEQILRPQTVEALTARHRTGMLDHTFDAVADWGLGFLVDSKQYNSPGFPYGFGPHSSARAFGHGGYQSSVSYADPEHGLVVVVIANGGPGEQKHNRRFRAVNSAIYEELGLA
jgi:CubicO group peptidase (beta-lactamase class C family)